MFRITRELTAAVVVSAAVLAGAIPSAARAVEYAALGDSFSSGVGSGRYDLDRKCRRTSKAYPARVAAATGFRLRFTACSGATTMDVIDKQMGSLSATTDYVTVTAGGNDAGFARLIATCTLRNCVRSVDGKRKWASTVLPILLDDLYAVIQAEAPNATVIVLGYPRLFSGSTCGRALGISRTEQLAANGLVDAIDAVTAERAATYGFTYMSAIARFTGHALCSPSQWFKGLSLRVADSYHPNASGQRRGYAPLVRAVTG